MELDTLDIQIKASVDDADKAIKNLTKSLVGLGNALSMASLNTFVARMQRLSNVTKEFDVKAIDDLRKSLNKLSNAGKSLANFGLDKVTKQANQVSGAAKSMSDKIAREWGITDKKAVQSLALAIENMFSVAGNDAEVGKAISVIDKLIKEYAQIGIQADDTAAKVREMVSASSLVVPSRMRAEWGDDYKSNMGTLGIRNTTTNATKGTSVINLMRDINTAMGMDADNGIFNTMQSEEDALSSLVEYLKQAQKATLSYNEAVSKGAISTGQLDHTLNSLAQSVGTTTDATSMAALSSGQTFSQIMNEVTAKVENLKAIASAASPFERFIDGLADLDGITIPDFTNFQTLASSANVLGGTSATRAGQSMIEIANGLRAIKLVGGVDALSGDVDGLTSQLRGLGSKGVVNAAASLGEVASGLTAIKAVGEVHVDGLADLAQSLSMFGRSTAQNAITTIPQLATAFRSLIDTLSTAPTVSQNVIDLANAMANLSGNMRAMPSATDRAGKGLKLFHGHAQKAQKSAFSLAATIGKLYATYWAFLRVGRWFGSSMKLASDLVEVQNVVDNVFTDMSEKMDDFARTAVDTLGMSELTAKEIGSRFQSMGKNMGVPKEAITSTNDFLTAVTKMGDGSEKSYAGMEQSMADVSLNLTKLAGDMASFYNKDYKDVAKTLESIFTGQTRPLRQYGLDITQATLKEFALANGMDANIKKMSQYEKMLLRYQYVMANTTAAHGDFERTINTFANQVRIAQERLVQLKKVLGTIGINVFKPLVRGFNDAMNSIIHLAESTLNALGKIFGWKVEITDVGTLADDSEDLADNLDDAAGSAKKMKDYMLGIDELNVFNPNDGKGGGAGDVTGGADAAQDALVKWEKTATGYDSIYDTLFKLGKRIAEVQKEWLQGIDWDAIYDKAERFGKGLAKFLNGYLSDAELFYEKGGFIAKAINTIAHALDAFAKEFDGYQLGIDIGSWINGFVDNLDWKTIQSAATGLAKDFAQAINGAIAKTNWKNVGKTIAQGINTAIKFFSTLGSTIQWKRIGKAVADSINGLFADIDLKSAGKTVSTWAKGILDLLITALEKTDWKKVGKSIGEFLAGIDFIEIGAKAARLLWDALNAGVKAYIGMFEAAPIESAILGVLALPGLASSVSRGVSNLFSAAFRSISSDFSITSLISNITGAFAAAGGGGNIFESLALGVNSFSSNLSLATKALGGLLGSVAEFAVIKDGIFDIVTGTGDITANLLEMAGVTAAVGTAMSLVLGFPGGLIATGIAGLVGGIVGLNKALDQVRENTVLEVLTTTYSESAVTVEKIAANFKTVADNIDSGLNKLHGQYEDLQTLRGNLENVAGGFALIASAASNGSSMTADAMNDIIGNLADVQSAWEQYIDAHYDYLMQGVIADYQFAKSQGTLTKEMEQDYLNRLSNLSRAHDTESSELKDLMSNVEEARDNLDKALNANISVSAINDAKHALEDAYKELLNFGTESGAISDEYTDKLNTSLKELSENVSSIDFSNLDSSSYDAFAADLISQNEQIQESYDNTYEDIARNMKERIAEGTDPAYAEQQANLQFHALNDTFKNAMDAEMTTLYDKFYQIIATGDAEAANEYAANVITPFVDSIQENYVQAADGAQPFLADATTNLLNSAFDSVYEWRHDAGWGKTVYTLKDGWIDIFWQVRDEAVGPVRKSTQGIVEDSVSDIDASPMEEKGTKLGTDFVDAFVEGGAKGFLDKKAELQTAVESSYDNVDTTFAENKGSEIAEQFIKGGAKGLINGQPEIKEESKNLAQMMLEGVAEPLEVNSPSRKAIEIGQYFDEGLANGISENKGLVEAAISEMMADIEAVYNSATDVFKPDTFITSFNTITGGMTTMIGQMRETLTQFDTDVKQLISDMFNDLLPTKFTETNETFTTTLGETEKSITTFDENVGKKITALFDEILPEKIGNNETLITGSLGEIEKAVGTSIGSVQEEFEKFLKWFDKNILEKTKGEYWTNALSGVSSAFETTFRGVANSITIIMNTLIEQINTAMNVKWDNLVVNGQTVMEAGQAKLFEITPIPLYENGGFPRNGELFIANERGAEMVGSFGSRTAVANNDQIVSGIREGVQEAMTEVVFNMLNPYLSDIAQSSRETANKDFSVNIGDRDIAMANNRGQSLVGMSIIS